MDDRRHRLPHLIDAPPRVGIWDADVAAIALSGLVLAIVIKVFWLPFLAGIAAGLPVRPLQDRQAPGLSARFGLLVHAAGGLFARAHAALLHSGVCAMNKNQFLHEAALRLGVRAAVLVVIATLLLANVALALRLATEQREQTIELQLPGALTQSAWVSSRAMSPEYLVDTGFFIAELALNVSPASAEHQLKLLKHYAAPEYAGALEQAYVQGAQRLRDENASTAFWPATYVVDPTGEARVAISGTLATYVGDKRISEAPKTYRIALRWARWRAALVEFAEVDAKQPFAAEQPAAPARP